MRAAYRWAMDQIEGPNVAEGKVMFLADCAPCHGLGGHGGRGPALVGRVLTHGSSEKELLAVIHNGIPGTSMPSFRGYPDEERNVAVYVQNLSGVPQSGATHHTGDTQRGFDVYERMGCARCHLVGNTGSVFGPDLTHVGVGHSYEYLKQSLLEPSAEITPGSEGVAVITVDGKRIEGIRINEDTFTIQLRDRSQQFLSFEKSEVRTVLHLATSLMPSYARIPGEDLENLLAYLLSLHGDITTGRPSPRELR